MGAGPGAVARSGALPADTLHVYFPASSGAGWLCVSEAFSHPDSFVGRFSPGTSRSRYVSAVCVGMQESLPRGQFFRGRERVPQD